ncbi:hypothetical protein J2S19_003785 [Metabacillus malikii]|uniref:Uncharacterized protein n=1 Tax=Metabacillus malikii TaxID=1504265 RepID=A0ABT9ZKQ5_9BACI|nr:hypothetical protein [Metabacillus malikii]
MKVLSNGGTGLISSATTSLAAFGNLFPFFKRTMSYKQSMKS